MYRLSIQVEKYAGSSEKLKPGSNQAQNRLKPGLSPKIASELLQQHQLKPSLNRSQNQLKIIAVGLNVYIHTVQYIMADFSSLESTELSWF